MSISEDLRNNHDLSIDEILKQHNTNLKQVMNAPIIGRPRKECRDKKLLYIYKHSRSSYEISKYRKGKHYYFGVYKCLEDAIIVRDALKSVDWNVDCLDDFLKVLGVERIVKMVG